MKTLTIKTIKPEIVTAIKEICELLEQSYSVNEIAATVKDPYNNSNLFKNLIVGVKYRRSGTDISAAYSWEVNKYEYSRPEAWQQKMRPKIVNKISKGFDDASILRYLMHNVSTIEQYEAEKYLNAMKELHKRETVEPLQVVPGVTFERVTL